MMDPVHAFSLSLCRIPKADIPSSVSVSLSLHFLICLKNNMRLTFPLLASDTEQGSSLRPDGKARGSRIHAECTCI